MSQRGRYELFSCGAALLLILNLLFFPVIWGNKTLLNSARGTASILPTGAYDKNPVVSLDPPKSNDPGAAAWFAEPNYALLHSEIVEDHEVPLWNPYSGCGVPWMANMQSQVLNPLQSIAWLAPSPRTIDLYLLTRLFVAGILMFLFLRQFLSFIPALFGAVTYMQTGYLVIYIGMPDISVCAYIPGLFWAAERLFRQSGLINICLSTLFCTLILVGGMPEIAFLAFVFLSVYLLCRLLANKTNLTDALGLLGRFAAAAFLAALLCAPQLLTFLDYMSESFNAHDLATGNMPGVAYNPRFFLHLLNYLVPLIYGPLLRPGLRQLPQYFGFVGYWGTITSFLAFLALITLISRFLQRRSDEREIDVLALFSAVGFLFLLAKRFAFPLVQWIGTLPVLRMIIFWKYSEPLMAFFICTLASIALYWLSARSVTVRRVGLAFAAFAAFYIFVIAVNASAVVAPHAYFKIGCETFGLAVVSFALCLLSARRPRSFSRFAPYLVALACLELSCNFVVPTYYKFSRFAPAQANPYAGAPFVTELQRLNVSNERIFSYDAVLYPNWASAFKLFDIRDLDAMYPVRYFSFLRMFAFDSAQPQPLGEANLTTRFTGVEPQLDPLLCKQRMPAILRLWQLTSTAYILGTRAHFAPEGISLALDGATAGDVVSIFHLPKVLPRAALFYHVDIADDGADALRRIASADYPLWKTVTLERGELTEDWLTHAGLLNINWRDGRMCEAETIEEYRPMFVKIKVQAKQAGILVLNDTWSHGWNAYVDGNLVRPMHGNFLFRAIFVPAGAHTVVYKYEPEPFRIGLCGSAAALAIFAVWSAISLLFGRPGKREGKLDQSSR